MVRQRRRAHVLLACAAMVAGALAWLPAAPLVTAPELDRAPATRADLALLSDRVVLAADGTPHPVAVGATSADDVDRRVRQDRWIADGVLPGPDRYAGLAERALRDLDALVLDDGAVLAAASGEWRYVWPRDSAFVAVALARTGHDVDALTVLRHLQGLQDGGTGLFQARYLPDGTGAVPDDRGVQLDGSGWVLWAVAEWYGGAPRGTRDADLATLRPLVTRSVATVREHVDPGTGLPVPSPDYWEVRETRTTLGTVAALLLGLRAAGDVLDALGEPPADDLVRALDDGLDRFAPGYGRYPGGLEHDTAVTFLMPPFAPFDRDVAASWRTATEGMARPAGGLAPGVGWRDDGVSWTPTTALFALTAAATGDRASALRWLDWLDAHRTPGGALPEKVLWDGRPAAVAPLAWTCALVVLTLDELDRLDARPWDHGAPVQAGWIET